ncbi:MAG: calcium/proton exchanger [Planctomycetia bacterium]|nr:calcium/proton exchanger [Planctomycetia bacterium]
MTKQPAAGRSKSPKFRIEPLYWLMVAVPVAIVLEVAHAPAVWVFIVSCLAVIPLAGLMGRATESLAGTLGAGIGGLLNATFGNAAELIIAIMAMVKGPSMYPLVKASLTGSIIGNVLLVLGLSMLAGGFKHTRQTFNRTAAGMGSTLLALASIGLIIPTIYFFLLHGNARLLPEDATTINHLSEEIAVILAATYLLSLFFSLKTHRHLFGGEEKPAGSAKPEWSRKTSILVLISATAGVALMSEFLVGSVETAGESLGMNSVFVGVVVLAIIGNAAEHSTAVLMALKNKMELSVSIAVGSSIQIALFVAPVLVFTSMLLHPAHPMDLHFTALEVVAVVLSIGVLSMVCQDGECHWMEGVMLLAVYGVLALAFYHLPTDSSKERPRPTSQQAVQPAAG